MAGKLPIDVDELNIDLASISSHKVNLDEYNMFVGRRAIICTDYCRFMDLKEWAPCTYDVGRE
jgi:hypothetical protein